jgi:hypothetical protein
MKNDELNLRLTIDVCYEMGRTSQQELELVLANAADHLAEKGLLSGETEASLLFWNSAITTTPKSEDPKSEPEAKYSGWITDRVPSDMRDVILDTDMCEGGSVVVGFWDTTDKAWRFSHSNVKIRDTVYRWCEMPIKRTHLQNERSPEWVEIAFEKTP